MISVIIPNYNRADQIGWVITNVLTSDFTDFEIIVVDDHSIDDSVSIIKNYPVKLIELDENHGPAYARNRGAGIAKGDILVFMDSDVLIKRNTLRMVNDYMRFNWLGALIGVPSFKTPFNNLSSQHFNWRTCFNFSNLKFWIDITWGSFTAVRKSVFEDADGYNEDLTRAGIEDNELGYDIIRNDHQIVIYHDLEVTHLKKISFKKLLKNDFMRTLDRVELLVRRRKFGSVLRLGRFISTPMDQLLSPLVALMTLLFPPCFPLFLLTQARYLSFVEKRTSVFKALSLVPLLFVDMLVVSFALIYGGTKQCLNR